MKFFVQKQRIELLERDAIAADQIAFVPLHFVFDGAWEGLHKVVQITQCCETYNLILGTDGKSCLLPSECKAGTMKLSVFGYAPSDTKALRATTIPVSLHIKPSGFVSDSATPIPPTPDLYAQLLQELEKKAAGLQNGKDGKDGISPAVTVTETESGATITITDATGTTTTELHNGEKGDKGEPGQKGERGLQGIPGEKGDPGADGKNGTDGFSPVATVTKSDNVVTIAITDKSGTTTATLTDGATTSDSVGQRTAEGGEIFNSYSGDHANKATWNNAHAEGYGTTACARGAHAEGIETTAAMEGSHAGGIGTNASGRGAYAGGIYTSAPSEAQHVLGKYNVADGDGKFAFIIGNGTEKKRSNAFAVDWNGKIYINNATDGVDVSALATQIGDIQTVLASIVEVET